MHLLATSKDPLMATRRIILNNSTMINNSIYNNNDVKISKSSLVADSSPSSFAAVF